MGLPRPHLVNRTLAVEYDEVQKRLVTLCAKAAQMAERISTAALPIDVGGALRAFSESPTTTEIQELADEIQAMVDRRRELEALLRDSGISPVA